MEESAQIPAFGMLLKRYRRAANFTQELLAERAGYSAIYLSKLERGERQPLAFTVATLADALGLDAQERSALEHAAHRVPAAPRERPPTRIPAGSDSLIPLVGRTEEQALLARYLEGEEPPLLLVLGEPGIGKTRLLQEAAQQGQMHGWRVLEGRCHRHSGQELYAPLLGALERSLARLSQAEQREALQQCEWLLRLLPEWAEEAGLSLPPWEVPPAQERRLLFAAVRRFLDQIAGPSGTLLVLDDLQWVSADTLDVLTSLFRADARRPLRLIGAYRNTEVLSTDALSLALADLAREVGAQRLLLGPLSAQDAERLLNLLLKGSVVDSEEKLVELVLRRAGGVPYFLVSCAQGMRAGTLGGTAREAIPWQVTETIRQRVGALFEAAQYLLGVVAVAGSEARRSLLLTLATQLGWGKREALLALEQACQARLLVEQGEHSYTFAHDLIREVLIEDMSAARRAMLHQHIAEILEQGAAQPPVEALAYHYSQAGLYEQAMGYLEQAGDRARIAYAHEQAERYYRAWLDQALRLEHPAEAARARFKLGGVLFVCGHYREALTLLEETLAFYQQTGDLEEQAKVAEKMGQVYAALGAAEQGILLLQRWLASPTLPALSVYRRGALHLALAYLLMNSSRNTEALPVAQQAVELVEQTQDTQLLGTARRYLGRVLRLLGRLKEAAQEFEAAVPLAEQAGDLRCLCLLLPNLSLIAIQRGEFVAGKHYVERAALLAEQVGAPILLAHVVAARGLNAFVLGDWQHARQDYEQAVALMRQAEMPWGTADTLLHLGEQLLALGQKVGRAYLEEAIELAQRSNDLVALRMAQRVLAEQELLLGAPQHAYSRLKPLLKEYQQDRPGMFFLLPLLAWAQLELGEEGQAQRMLDQARAGATGEQLRPVLAETSLVQARLAAHQEQWQAAEKALEAALRLCRAMPWPYGEAKTLYVAGLVSRQRGESAQARAHFEAALTILQRLGERLYARVIQQALAQLPAHEPQTIKA
ncbi:MAG TPA: AAA family ATPase [Ktedonobacterales bacterium]|nr:AAA family ATPase [Ktedonobacterales bacterium]